MTSNEEQQKAQDRVSFRAALDTKSVRDVLWNVIEMGNVYARSGPQGVEAANYFNGKRDLALELIEIIEETSPDHWALMQQEGKGELND